MHRPFGMPRVRNLQIKRLVHNHTEITLTGSIWSEHSLVVESKFQTSLYGHFNLPIVLKKEDTLAWLREGKSELKIQQIIRNILASTPKSKSSDDATTATRKIVINVGAHECFFCVIFALNGYRVYAVEPLPKCVTGIQETFSLYPQDVVDRVSLYNNYVSDYFFEIETPANLCSGKFSMARDDMGLDRSPKTKVGAIRLSEIVIDPGVIDFLAIDTEGAEIPVLSSARPIFRNRIVNNIVFEYTPMWYRTRMNHSLESAVRLLEEIISLQRYRCYLLRDFSGSVANTSQIDIRTLFQEDWSTNSTHGQSDIYCTRCKSWVKVFVPMVAQNSCKNCRTSDEDVLPKNAVTELCTEYS